MQISAGLDLGDFNVCTPQGQVALAAMYSQLRSAAYAQRALAGISTAAGGEGRGEEEDVGGAAEEEAMKAAARLAIPRCVREGESTMRALVARTAAALRSVRLPEQGMLLGKAG